MTNPLGSARTRALELLRESKTWMRAADVRRRIGYPASLTMPLAPDVRDGHVLRAEANGQVFYCIAGVTAPAPLSLPGAPMPPSATGRRFQLQPVWPPGFVPRYDAVSLKDIQA
jgi:hypothetical protein